MAILATIERSGRSVTAGRPLLLVLGLVYLVAASAARSPRADVGAALLLGIWAVRLVLVVRRARSR